MNILALDSAGKRAGVAILQNGQIVYDAHLDAGFTHSETLLCMVKDALHRTNLDVSALDCIGVNVGPGSFTGLRIGIAIAKGLALPNQTPCVGVSTLQSIASTSVVNGTILCALDARRGEVYHAAFQMQNGTVTRLTPDDAGSIASLQNFVQTAPKPLYFMGDGAHLCAQAFASEPEVFLYPTPYTQGRAWGTAQVSAQMLAQNNTICADKLVAQYHRLSQAQRERAERENKPL